MIEGHKVAAFCVSEIQNENTQSMVYPTYQALAEHGWKCIIFNSATDLFRDTAFDRGEASIFQLIHYGFVDAVILYTQYLKNKDIVEDVIAAAAKHDTPVFLIEPSETYCGGIRITFDETDAFRQLMLHLTEHHHFTKLACIAGFQGNPVSESRVQVFRDVLAEHQIPFQEKWFGYGNFYSVPTREVMERFLADPDGLPEAIVCINDSMAIAVCEILAEHQYRVPQDVVVTGFDGIVQERYNFPRITTCRRDLEKFGSYLVDLLEQAVGGERMQQEYQYPYTLDVSESCGCRRCSMESVSHAILSIYSRMNDNAQYDRSMNNMLTKLTFEQDKKEIQDVLRYYIRSDSCICMNSDFDDDTQSRHTYYQTPFTATMHPYRFIYGEEDHIDGALFPSENLFPNWQDLLQRDCPVVVYSIHNQQNVYGYMLSFAKDFGYTVERMQRFVISLNSSISMYVQQAHLRNSNQRLKEIQNKIIASFADLVESRDDFTGQHVKRTSEYLKILVEHLAKLPQFADFLTKEMQDLMCKAAPLHDIGKIKISDVVLNKPGRLTPEEFEVIKTHTLEGGEIIERTLTDIESDAYLKIASEMALYHHEKWDGTGYPYHLAGEEIPLCARIMAVVDVFDALTSKRVYKEAFPVDKAFQIVKDSSGTHFDPIIAETFLSIRDEVEMVLNTHRDMF